MNLRVYVFLTGQLLPQFHRPIHMKQLVLKLLFSIFLIFTTILHTKW
jgi:hypothetical protein